MFTKKPAYVLGYARFLATKGQEIISTYVTLVQLAVTYIYKLALPAIAEHRTQPIDNPG
jgi:hypothetical protein